MDKVNWLLSKVYSGIQQHSRCGIHYKRSTPHSGFLLVPVDLYKPSHTMLSVASLLIPIFRPPRAYHTPCSLAPNFFKPIGFHRMISNSVSIVDSRSTATKILLPPLLSILESVVFLTYLSCTTEAHDFLHAFPNQKSLT